MYHKSKMAQDYRHAKLPAGLFTFHQIINHGDDCEILNNNSLSVECSCVSTGLTMVVRTMKSRRMRSTGHGGERKFSQKLEG